jgi:hypothetical protein
MNQNFDKLAHYSNSKFTIVYWTWTKI